MPTFVNSFHKIVSLLNLPYVQKKANDDYISMISSLTKQVVENKISNGQIAQRINTINENAILADISKSEFKVFSQWGDDGIISFLVDYLDIEDKTFVEFGVENYTECNTRFLLINKNWRGLIMDGSKSNMESVRHSDIYWQYDLTALDVFVNCENINQLLVDNGFTGEIGLLHIDIDGNDYWIWDKINVVNPVIVVIEYNSLFGVDKSWTIPYDADFYRGNAHYSNLYYGVSIKAICALAAQKGYKFIGCNSNGNNAYFVRNDKMKKLVPKSVNEGYVESKFSEHRSEDGILTFLRGKRRIEAIRGLPIFNTDTGEIENI